MASYDPATERDRVPTADLERSAKHRVTEQLEHALHEAVAGEVRFDAGSRAMYTVDASNYRQPPVGVVVGFEDEAALCGLAKHLARRLHA